MSKKQKLYEKFRRNPRNNSLRDFEALVKAYGGRIEPGRKHKKAIIGNSTLPYKKESPIKSCYVKHLPEMIDSL